VSAEKAVFKADVIHDVGLRLEDVQEASLAAARRCEGAEQALIQAASVVQSLHIQVDQDLESGVIKDLEVASLVKEWVTRAVGVVDQLAKNAHIAAITQHGHAQGMAAAVKLVHQVKEAELRNAAALREREANRDEEFGSIKAQRQAEEVARSEAPGPVESVPPHNGASVRPRRRAARKADLNGPNA
jgi:DNA-binding protein H-NS